MGWWCVMALWLLCVHMSWIRWPRMHIHTYIHTHGIRSCGWCICVTLNTKPASQVLINYSSFPGHKKICIILVCFPYDNYHTYNCNVKILKKSTHWTKFHSCEDTKHKSWQKFHCVISQKLRKLTPYVIVTIRFNFYYASWRSLTFETNSVRGSVTSRKCFRRPTNVSYI